MPLSIEEYHIAQMFMVMKMQQQNTTGNEGVEILENRPFEDDGFGQGQYTSKIYRLQSKAPTWLTKLAPEDALVMQEEAWNAYPMCKSGLYSYLGICIHEECLFSASFQFSFLNTSNDFLVVVWNSTSCSYKVSIFHKIPSYD
nr:phosphatidylinositol transfer protein 2-like [Ipomoea batatas]